MTLSIKKLRVNQSSDSSSQTACCGLWTAYLFFLAMALSGTIYGQGIISLWPDEAIPNYRESEEQEERIEKDIVRYAKVQKPEIDVYLPSKKNATGEAVVICPGGGYQILAWDWEGLDIASWLNSHGIAAIVLKYRLPLAKSNIVRHKSPLLDAQRAIRYVRYHALEWNIDPSRIGIMGFSAGGHLASTAGTHYDLGNPDASDSVERMSSRPDFMILMYPVITFSEDVMHSGSREALLGEDPSDELVRFFSGELNVTEDTPPTFLVHAADDLGVPVENSLLFFEALKKNKIPVEMHIFPKGGHGFSLGIGMGHLATWPDMCIRWINWLEE